MRGTIRTSRYLLANTKKFSSLSAPSSFSPIPRLFVLVFVLNDHWEAVGFLLAAKSVFRFGNLKESHDRKLTEYVLIGTLLSFGIALVVALLIARLLPLVDASSPQ